MEIDQLKQRVLYLTEQLEFYKTKMFSLASGQEKEFTDYYDSKDYLHNDFIEKSFNSSPEESFEKFKEICKMFGPAGEIRRKMIKKCFRTIVDTIIPEGLRVGFQLIPHLNSDCNKEYSKLFEIPPASAIALLKLPPFHISDRYYYDHSISPEYRNHLAENKQHVIYIKSKITEVVHDLIKIRNRIFKIQDEYASSKTSIINRPDLFKAADFRKMLVSSKISNEDYGLSIFECWDIKRKSESTDLENDVYFTDNEV